MTKQALSVSFKSLKFNRCKFSNPSITKRQLGQGHGLLYGGPEDCILDPRAINRVCISNGQETKYNLPAIPLLVGKVIKSI